MKRVLLILMALMLLCGSAFADTIVNPTENRGITATAVSVNLLDDPDISPTTGLRLSELEIPMGAAGLAVTGRYMPMLVQICNPVDDQTRAAGTRNRAPWGVQYADIIYELQLHKNGETRMSALYSDILPEATGPIRSARMGHAWLREEWDCGFMFYGQQEYKQTNVLDEFRALGAATKGVLFPGTAGSSKPWKQFYERDYKPKSLGAKLQQPNDVTGNVAEISKLIPDDHTATNHTFKFADQPYTGGDAATEILVDWKRPGFNSKFTYDDATGLYSRSVDSENKKKGYTQWVELETKQPITFSNVIVQWTPTVFFGNDAPVSYNVARDGYPGEGNAEIFMNGRHIAGYWKREGMNTRTVFYDENGQEIAFQRGKTMIVQLPLEKGCSYK